MSADGDRRHAAKRFGSRSNPLYQSNPIFVVAEADITDDYVDAMLVKNGERFCYRGCCVHTHAAVCEEECGEVLRIWLILNNQCALAIQFQRTLYLWWSRVCGLMPCACPRVPFRVRQPDGKCRAGPGAIAMGFN